MNFLQRLFSQPKTEQDLSLPGDNTEETEPAIAETPINNAIGLDSLPLGIHVGKLSDVGLERERNEDSFYTIESLINHDLGQERFGLFIVADGMGGHQGGELASSLAARTTAENILEDVYLPYLNNSPSANSKPLNEALVSAVQNANKAVKETVPNGGTTLTVALIMGNNAYIAHVGDSRAYVLNKGTIKQITQDHSLAKRLEDTGQATAEEAAQVQNVLYRALGQDAVIDVDTHMQHLPAGASLLLCSDGLWGQVNEDIFMEIFASASTPQAVCEALIDKANENGGPDNITAIIVTMGVDA